MIITRTKDIEFSDEEKDILFKAFSIFREIAKQNLIDCSMKSEDYYLLDDVQIYSTLVLNRTTCKNE